MSGTELLAHHTDGEGEDLILLNGIAMTMASWEPVAARLKNRFRVIRCDFRGQLMSPGTPPEAIPGHVQDLIALLDSLGVDDAHVVSTSFGGVIGTILAARQPERVRSLVSIASACGFDERMAAEVRRWREACLKCLETGDKGLLWDIFQEVVYSPAFVRDNLEACRMRRDQMDALPDGWFGDLAALLSSAEGFVLPDALGDIRCPTLVAAAEFDNFIPRSKTRILAEGIPGARFLMIPEVGHAAVAERPDVIADLCLEFLAPAEAV